MKSAINTYQWPQSTEGTCAHDNPLIEVLKPGYFRPDTRTIAHWIEAIKEYTNQSGLSDLMQLIPQNIESPLLVDYIKNPRKVISQGRLSKEELAELRAPQRIVLFYFLRKLAHFEHHNTDLIRRVNDLLCFDLFNQVPNPATPDTGVATLDIPAGQMIQIPKGSLIDALVEDQTTPLTYETAQTLSGHAITLDKLLVASPTQGSNGLVLTEHELPLTQKILPFRTKEQQSDSFRPSLVMCSPLFKKGSGKRTLNLELWVDFGKDQKDKAAHHWLVETAHWTEEASEITWMRPKVLTKAVDAGESILHYHYELDLGDVEEQHKVPLPIYPLRETHGYLRLISQFDSAGFILRKAEASLKVDGLLIDTARNQEQVINPDEAFELFGTEAPADATFSFSHPELNDRKIKSFEIEPKWFGKPAVLPKYYEAYPGDHNEFSVSLHSANTDVQNLMIPTRIKDKSLLFQQGIRFDPGPSGTLPDTPLDKCWNPEETDPLKQPICYQLTLSNTDFGHSQYPALLATYMSKINVKDGYIKRFFHLFKKKKGAKTQPNPPYTPKASRVELSYKSSTYQWGHSAQTFDFSIIRPLPFGHTSYSDEKVELEEEAYGAIYFGISAYTPGQPCSFYFHGAAGKPQGPEHQVVFHYLTQDGWHVLPAENLLFDSTDGFRHSGLLYWKPPADGTTEGSRMPKGYFWFRAIALPCEPRYGYLKESIMHFEGILPNGIPIKRKISRPEDLEGSDHLPAGTQLNFQDPFADQKLMLPHETAGLAYPEQQLEFWARVFGRIKNRGQLVQADSFERVLLRKFRILALVRCIPRSQVKDPLRVVVMRKIDSVDLEYFSKQQFDHMPYVARLDLLRIKQLIYQRATPFFRNQVTQQPLSVEVTNPEFVSIGFLIHLEFKRLLNDKTNELRVFEAIQNFINPWFFKPNVPIRIGPWFSLIELANQLQKLPFVSAVFEIKLARVVDGMLDYIKPSDIEDNEVMVLTDPKTIIVAISPLEFAQYGIGSYRLGQDLIISKTEAP